MEFIQASKLNADILMKNVNAMPFIFCSSSPRIMRNLKEAGFTEKSLNIELASKLLAYPPCERPLHVGEEFQNILARETAPVLLTDYEMLFDPTYNLDVLRIFCDAARFRRIAIIWCGLLREEKLTYSDPQYSDYHVFDLNQYTVICAK